MLGLVTRLYAVLLQLYPRSFHDEFGDEMRSVFTQMFTNAMELGGMAWLGVCWREIHDLPGTLWQVYAPDDKEAEMNRETSSLVLDEKRLSWRETVVGLFPFALASIILLTSYPSPPPAWKYSREWQILTMAAYLVPILVVLGIGWAAKFPRWSYPYLGLGSFVLAVGMFGEPMRNLPAFRDVWAQVLAMGLLLFSLFGGLILSGSVWHPMRPLYNGVRRDWTQFSFGLYIVAALLASSVDHDDYPTLTAMVMLPALILLLGAFAYLRSTTKPQRILSMLIALCASVAVRVLENKEFYPTMIAILGVITFLPALFEFLPRSEKTPRAV